MTLTNGAPGGPQLYLDLMKSCLTRELFADEQVADSWRWAPQDGLAPPKDLWPILESKGLRIVETLTPDPMRRDGENWFPHADTMVGRSRLDNVQELITRIIDTNVPGDLVETGVWRGGTVAFMRAVLAAYGDEARRIWVCDSFEGLPEPDPDRYPADAEFVTDDPFVIGWTASVLPVTVDSVKATIDRYGLLDDRFEFVKGWFKDTLPTAPIDEIALLRLDGDFYESTMDGLVNLESKVSEGGFVIVDDYNGLEACRRAVDDYRAERGIHDPIHDIDWTGVWWQKGSGK